MEARQILLDMDVGIDDAMAIIYLAAREDAEIVAVGTTHGNCTAELSAENALRVLELCGLDDVPVALGAAEPIEQPLELADFVHGSNGLGEVDFPAARGEVSGEHAVDQLIRLSKEREGELDLFAAAPLTNVGLAVQRDPDVLTRFRSVVIMGGSGPFPPPPVHLCVDPNVAHDILASEIVYAAARSQMTMVGMNVTEGVLLDEPAFARIEAAETEHGRFVAKILPFYLDFHSLGWGRRVGAMHDPVAAAVMLDESYMTGRMEGPVNVMSGEEGARAWLMELETGGPPVHPITPAPSTIVATALDGERFIEEFVSYMEKPLPG